MNIFIITLGTRGDVQPYVALGKGLKAAGHTVTVCTSSSFESFITDNGLNYGYMRNDLLDLLDSDAGKDAIEDTVGLFGTIKTLIKIGKEANVINERLMYDSWDAAQAAEPDVVIYHPKGIAGPHIAEKFGIPALMGLPAPLIVPTAMYPVIGLPSFKFGGWYNQQTYKVIPLGYSVYDKIVNQFRQETLGLEKRRHATLTLKMPDGSPIPIMHCVSPRVTPRPDDWPDHATMNGYWFLDQPNDWQPSVELQAFLDAGDPPVYVGFGSMAGRKPQRLAQIVIEALQAANVRGVIATGWGGLDANDLPETIFKIDQAPHDWLFPRMAAVAHHGGAGTTAAGLRAGRPTVICSFIADQPFWGARVYALGVGPKHIPQKQLTVEKLAAAIREATTNPAMRQRAADLGEQIRAEDGVADTVALIERIAEKHAGGVRPIAVSV